MADRSTLPAQPTLFHDPPECTARGCLAGDRRNLCDYDARREQGELVGRRPRGCIGATYNPATSAWPAGY